MTSYSRRGYSPFGGRRSPYGASSSHGQIRESDFEYVEPDRYSSIARREEIRYSGEYSRHNMDDENAPDVITIRHLNAHYPLRFKPYAISDGLVTIGDIRYFAAEMLKCNDPRRLTLLYKNRKLRDDDKTAKAEGLKQRSEITVVITESVPSDSISPGSSENDDGHSSVSSDPLKSSKKRRKEKSSRHKQAPPPPVRDSASPSAPGSAGSASSPPRNRSPPDPNSPHGKVDQLAVIYATQWKPLCLKYLEHPPTDPKAKDFEHKKLTESILSQIILKADNIELQGDDRARQARRALLTEAQDMLKKLDTAIGKTN